MNGALVVIGFGPRGPTKHAATTNVCFVSGFTLVELSIVLLIIGFVAGGILVGRALVHTAEIRSVLTQLGHYDAAAMTFKNKYGGLPGDLAQAEEAGLAEAGCPDVYGYGDNECFYAVVLRAGCSGNGNGMFDDGNGAANYLNCPENLNFWYHLKQAGLLDGPADGKTVSDINPVWGRPIFGASAPLTRLRNVGIMVATYTPLPPRRANYYTLGLSDRYDILPSARTKALRGHEAFTIDNKLDDGLPTTGRVLVYVLSMPQCIAAGQYRMADETSNCGLFINTAVLGGQQ